MVAGDIGIQLITSTLANPNLLMCAVNSSLLYFSGKYFERIWGSKELLKHFCIVTLSTNVLTLIIFIIRFRISGFGEELFTKISGMGGFLCALVIAFKRAIPEHSIKIFQTISVRVKYLPSILILGHFVLYVFGFILSTFYTHTIAMIISWIYMRYYKYLDGVRGDRSETFSFASFFPDSWAGAIKPLSTTVYTTLVNLKLLPPLPNRQPVDLESPNQPIVPEDPFEKSQKDSERRKALALQALEARLQRNQ